MECRRPASGTRSKIKTIEVENPETGLEWNGYHLLGTLFGKSGFSVIPPTFSLRKEVIQPQVLLRLPCYDFTPIMNHTLDRCLLAVGARASSTIHFRDVTGGVYKARERIHGAVLMRHY